MIGPRIEGYDFGRIVVDGEELTRDVIILPDRLVTNWWRAEGHRLALAEFDDVLGELPDHLVVGPEASVRHYGALDPRRRAAALHVTC